MRQSDDDAADAALLEVMTVAAVTGHELGAWQPFASTAGEGWQARCRRCGQTAAVWRSGLVYSLLDDECGKKSAAGDKLRHGD